jgi:hypothetical protein
MIIGVHYFKFAAMPSVDLERVQRIGIMVRRMAKSTADWRGVTKSTETIYLGNQNLL